MWRTPLAPELEMLLEDLNSIIQAEASARQLYLTIDTGGIAHADVCCDKLRINQIMINILSNAVKYAPGGHVKVWSEGERLFIQDDGVGIAAEDLPRIFERGFTGYNGRMDKRATGIGLYLSQEICRKLGHTITVESELGKGTRVTVGLARPYLEVE